MTESDLTAATTTACKRYGAQRVYDAAHQAMGGHHAALSRVELLQAAGNLPALNLVSRMAYKRLSGLEQAADLADVVVDLARMSART
jgi:hypothetical protein